MEFVYEILVRPITNYARIHDDFRMWLERRADEHDLGELITCRIVRNDRDSKTHGFVSFRQLQSNAIAIALLNDTEFDGRRLSWIAHRKCVVPLAIGPVKTEAETQTERVTTSESSTQCEVSLYTNRLRVEAGDRVRSSSVKRKMED